MNLNDQKILIVDDDATILSSFERVFHRSFNVTTCADAVEALCIFKSQGPFAVVISDMHMPGIDGISFLHKIKDINPDPVRIMLTGDSDIQTAVNAVNEGHIFRFLLKPCDSNIMASAINAAIQQYRLITAEHELLEKTLKGSIQILVEVLSMTNPIAFNKAKRISNYASQLARLMNLPNAWQYEIAAMLSQIGCLTVPPETIEKYFSGLELNEDERSMVKDHPNIGYELLSNIPRLENIAAMIRVQQYPPKDKFKRPLSEIEPAALGSLILCVCFELELMLTKNFNPTVAIKRLEDTVMPLVPEMAKCFSQIKLQKYASSDFKFIKISELSDGMLLADAIIAKNGTIIAGKDCSINPAIRQRLFNFLKQGVIDNIAKVTIQQ